MNEFEIWIVLFYDNADPRHPHMPSYVGYSRKEMYDKYGFNMVVSIGEKALVKRQFKNEFWGKGEKYKDKFEIYDIRRIYLDQLDDIISEFITPYWIAQ